MKPLFLLLWLLSGVPCVDSDAQYKHKSEAEISRMTARQRVDEYADEKANHGSDISDAHSLVLVKYVRRDGLKALPRMLEIMNEYDPTAISSKSDQQGYRFDTMLRLLRDFDNNVVRLRGSDDGRRAMDTLERAINRMRAAGSGQKEQQESERNGRIDFVIDYLEDIKGVGYVDIAIMDTLWVQHKLQISTQELSEFSIFLVAHDPTYPSWSETQLIKDYSRTNDLGIPSQVYIMKKPERFYKAYRQFKKAKR